MKKLFAGASALTLALSMFAVAPVVSADSEAVSYDYIIGEDLGAGPAIAVADNGDTVEINGAGSLTTHPKSVAGGGDFTHNFFGGGSVSGTWTADKLISFDGYGCGGEFPPDFCGGRAIIGVTLSVGGVPVATGVLQVDCLIGDFPASAMEGVRLNVKDALNFNHEISGFTVFID